MAPKRKGGYVRKYAAKVGKNVYNAARKRYTTKGKVDLVKIAKDVQMLKTMANSEKKRYDISATNQVAGQILNSSSVTGAYIDWLTIFGIPQGTTATSRNGNSIKVNSIIAKFRVQQQASGGNYPVRCRFILFTMKGVPQSSGSTLLNRFYDNNPFSGVVDINSSRNPDNYQDFQVLGSKQVIIPADNITGQVMVKDITMPLKVQRHMRWDSSGNLQEFPVYLCVVTDLGDCGTAATGIKFDYNIRTYFYDN